MVPQRSKTDFIPNPYLSNVTKPEKIDKVVAPPIRKNSKGLGFGEATAAQVLLKK